MHSQIDWQQLTETIAQAETLSGEALAAFTASLSTRAPGLAAELGRFMQTSVANDDTEAARSPR